MHCISCGAEVAEGSKFCPVCGAAVPTVLTTQSSKPIMYQPTSIASPADELTTEPVRSYTQEQPVQSYVPPQQPVQSYVPPQQPAKRGSNGPAVTGLVFNIINIAVLVVAWALASSGSVEVAAVSAIFLVVSFVLYIFAFIFSLIGFIKGLRTGAHRVLGIVSFVLFWVSVVILAAIGANLVDLLRYL